METTLFILAISFTVVAAYLVAKCLQSGGANQETFSDQTIGNGQF